MPILSRYTDDAVLTQKTNNFYYDKGVVHVEKELYQNRKKMQGNI